MLVLMAIVIEPEQVLAKHWKHAAHHHRLVASVRDAHAALSQPSDMGTMRYYGGPKSPMWRSVQ